MLTLLIMPGVTPLLQAMIRNKAEVATLLLEAGAQVDMANSRGETPLMIAAKRTRKGADDIIALLLAAGADVNASTDNGTTALISAAHAGKSGTVLQVFLDAGADVNARDTNGYSALMYAALLAQDDAAITVLLDAGADDSFTDAFEDNAAAIIQDNVALASSDVASRLSH